MPEICSKMSLLSSVTLALPDEFIERNKDPLLPWTTNKIGGVPNWMSVSPSFHPRCKICQSLLLLIIQIYCPLESSVYHRVLHVFGCLFPGCCSKASSYVVLRSQEKEKVTESKVPMNDNSWQTDSWGCEDADDWGMDEKIDDDKQEESYTTSNLCAALEINCHVDNQMSISSTMAPCKQPLETPCQLPQFFSRYVFAVSHSLDIIKQREDLSHEKQLLAKYEQQEGFSVESITHNNSNSSEKYEESKSKHGDAKFERFKKVISTCPQQFMRYSSKLEILPYSDQTKPSHNLDDIPVCNLCNSPRRLELQLLPSLPWLLKLTTDCDNTSNRIDFGCLFIFTCKSSCWLDDHLAPIEEFIVYQADPDSNLLDNLNFE